MAETDRVEKSIPPSVLMDGDKEGGRREIDLRTLHRAVEQSPSTVVITDAGGRVIFSDQTRNYRVRPDPEIFLRVLSSHGVEGRTQPSS